MATSKRPVTVIVTRNRKEVETAEKLLLAAGFRWRGGEGAVDLPCCSAIFVGEGNPTDLCFASGPLNESYRNRPVLILEAAELCPGLVAKLSKPNRRSPRKITLKWLRKRNACTLGLDWFAATFGRTATVDPETLRRALPDDKPSRADWLDEACRR